MTNMTNMTKIKKSQAWLVAVKYLVELFPIWFLFGLISGVTFAFVFESALAFGIGCFAVPIACIIILTKKNIVRYNNSIDYMVTTVKDKLQNVDYYSVSPLGAIAVDAKHNKIAIVNGEPLSAKFDAAVIIEPAKIKSYRAFSPAHSTWVSSGAGVIESSEIERKNSIVKAKAAKKTGLYFDLDDVTLPQVISNMDYEDAEKWMLIIEKILNGTLDTQPSPMYYPPQ
ncbi:hypothetical protein ACK4A2_03390 [Aeromonas veronii]